MFRLVKTSSILLLCESCETHENPAKDHQRARKWRRWLRWGSTAPANPTAGRLFLPVRNNRNRSKNGRQSLALTERLLSDKNEKKTRANLGWRRRCLDKTKRKKSKEVRGVASEHGVVDFRGRRVDSNLRHLEICNKHRSESAARF